MTTIHDRLSDLAAAAPAAPPAPGDLWDRGRRYQRRRRGGTLVVLACALLVLAGTGGLAWHRAAAPDPVVPAGAPAGLPDRLHPPSRWLPGTADAGELGALAAVVSAQRSGWLHSSPGLVGVSTTGEYRFLDLPGADPGLLTQAALAPDGRHVAYWYAGTTVGLAVYDTTTGEVRRSRVRAGGLFSPTAPSWAGPDTVVFQPSWRTGPDRGRVGQVLAWRVGDRSPHPVAPGSASVAGTGDDLVALTARGRTRLVDTTTGAVRGTLEVTDPTGEAVLDAAGTRVAMAVDGNAADGSAVRAGPLPAPGTELPVVPGVRPWRLEGWVDDQHLAVDVLGAGTGRLVSVDVTTGERRTLVDGTNGNTQVARGLLADPTYAAPAPPRPYDPRLVTLLAVVVVLAAVRAVVWWRRRVRP